MKYSSVCLLNTVALKATLILLLQIPLEGPKLVFLLFLYTQWYNVDSKQRTVLISQQCDTRLTYREPEVHPSKVSDRRMNAEKNIILFIIPSSGGSHFQLIQSIHSCFCQIIWVLKMTSP